MSKDDIFKCDICGEPATVNIQSLWARWNIDKDGNFSEEPEILYDFEPQTNVFYCDKCYEREFLGKKI